MPQKKPNLKHKSQNRAGLLRHLNTREVLAMLLKHGGLSRADLTRLTGISGPTITRTVQDLLDAKLVEEGEPSKALLGRPGKMINLATSKSCVMALAIGRDACEISTSGLDGRLQGSPDKFPMPRSYSEFLNLVSQKLAKPKNGVRMMGLGVSTPGLFNQLENKIASCPSIPFLENQMLAKDLEASTGFETFLLQEMHALCLAESIFGESRNLSNFAVIDITHDFGLGVVLNGQQLQGHLGLAGNLGKLPIDKNGATLDAVATDDFFCKTIARLADSKIDIQGAINLFRGGAVDAMNEINLMIDHISTGVATVVNLFNPERIFIIGNLLDAHPDLFVNLLEATRRKSIKASFIGCTITRSKANSRLGAVSAVIGKLTTGKKFSLK
ncbi:MAG: ROK family transcriptional regulator [Gemmataceae bacterium]|nr:ROK family transcriptional regulator [Gemmataceae bacterium]